MIKARAVPKKFWAKAIAVAVCLLNLSPTKAVYNRTPYETWNGSQPKVMHLRVFGCITYVMVHSH